jgi:hypothetical protein
MRAVMRTVALVLILAGSAADFGGRPMPEAYPQGNPPPPPPQAGPPPNQYSSNEIVDTGHRFFGTVARGLAQIVEKAGANGGCPTATSWARRPAAPWSPGCATARAPFIRRTRAT